MLRLPIVLLALLLALPTGIRAADYVAPPVAAADVGHVRLIPAMSRYLSLAMVRATFDVVPREELKAVLETEVRRWGGVAPSPEAAADIDGQLLAEASYYIVSLSYVVQVGGAAFPDELSDPGFANDTLVRLDSLQRQLGEAIESGGEVLPVLEAVEQIRGLTEGYAELPPGFGVFGEHAAILAEVAAELTATERT
jgi:hypothetical protein